MGNIADLNVSIGGDVKPLNAALNEAKVSLVGFGNLAKSLDNLRPFSPFIVKGIEAAKTVGQLEDALAQLKIEQKDALSVKELGAYNAAIKAVSTEIKTLSSSSTGVSQVGKSLSGAFSQIRQIAYILPGIGLAGIFNLAFEGISAAAQSLGIFNSELSQTDELSKDFAEGLEKGAGQAAEESAHLQVLASIAADVNLAMNERLGAVQKLQDTYPQHLGNLSKEAILTGQVADQLKLLNDQILNKALAQAAEKSIGAIGEQLFKVNQELPKQITLVAALQQQYNKLASNEKATGREGVTDATVSALTSVNAAKSKLTELYTTQSDLNKLFNETVVTLKDYAVKAGDAFTETDKKAKKTADSVKTVADILAELQKKLQLISGEQEVFGGNLDPDRIKAIETAIKGLLAIGVNPGDSLIAKLNAQADDLQAKLDKLRAGADLFALKGGGDKLENPIKQKNPVIVITDIENPKKYLERATQESEIAIEKMRKSLQAAVSNVFENIFESIGQSLGDAISGKGNPFEALGRVLGDGIKAIGAQLIKFGVAAEAVKLALKNPFAAANPFLLIAGGVALEAIGSAISNLGITPHADGGIFTKPTLIGSHLFGEKGPEALVPLSRMSEFGAGNSNNHIEVSGTVQFGYNGLLIAIERATRNTSRNYGNFNGK